MIGLSLKPKEAIAIVTYCENNNIECTFYDPMDIFKNRKQVDLEFENESDVQKVQEFLKGFRKHG